MKQKRDRFISSIFGLLKEAGIRCGRHNVPRLAASLSYYTAFSIAPLLLLSVSVAGFVFGKVDAAGKVLTELSTLLGRQTAQALEGILRSTQNSSAGVMATVIATTILLIGASGVMVELKDAFNLIWSTPEKSGLRVFFKDRLLSMGMVLVVGFLLLVSLMISAALAFVGSYLGGSLPFKGALLEVLNLVISFGIVAFMFAILFKGLPDTRVKWRDVWIGATLSSFLFSIGKALLEFYLRKRVIGSVYGAAGSVLVMLLWVYFSAHVLYFGAEFTKTVSDHHEST